MTRLLRSLGGPSGIHPGGLELLEPWRLETPTSIQCHLHRALLLFRSCQTPSLCQAGPNLTRYDLYAFRHATWLTMYRCYSDRGEDRGDCIYIHGHRATQNIVGDLTLTGHPVCYRPVPESLPPSESLSITVLPL